MDVRWASDDSVYVLWEQNGVAEVGLDGTQRRQMMPKARTFEKVRNLYRLAVTPHKLVTVAGAWNLLWRPLEEERKGSVLFRRLEVPDTVDFDVQGEKFVLLGTIQREKPWKSSGEVAWAGTFRSRLADWRPVLHDVGGRRAPHYKQCAYGWQHIGTVRFLADGSFVVAPGFQDGVHLFGAKGERVRTWSNAEIGIDSHLGCGSMSEEEVLKLTVDDRYLEKWLKSRRVLDEILPLPQGPGLLVRSWGADGLAHWTLRVLGPKGIQDYAVPVVGRRPFDRLHGDVRNGRIVLMLSHASLPADAPEAMSAELLLMEIPQGEGEGS